MTTIAWDGKTIAADRQCGGRYAVTKLWRLPDGSVIGGAGFYDDIVEIVAWLTEGAIEDKRPKLTQDVDNSSDLLLIDKDGTAYWLTWPYLRRVRINEPFVAVGSGSEYAIGAMAAGKGAKASVEIASRYDPSTGYGIDVVAVKRKSV